MDTLPKSTSVEEAERGASVAVLPVGSFEQHGRHLPLATDTIVACAIAEAVAQRYDLFLLPPITIACSHEHSDFAGTVSISAATLYQVIRDVQASLEQRGITKLVLVNGHGGNYVLGNVAQEANVGRRRMAVFPHRDDWERARKVGGLVTDNHEDMHGGELETSIVLAVAPEQVRTGFDDADHIASERTHLYAVGMAGYTQSGLIGRPSLATAEKGELVLADLTLSFGEHLRLLS
ncbi:creatininase family protein [Nocardioides sp. DS6]|uniref:Creatininase family protein n=1 Tax=Nocardioides eburneus TaxID=3231482 RepID=A0ABV3SXS0_9ACTN